MIKPKTKPQKEQDKKLLEKTALKCAKVLKEFMRDMYDCELDVSWLRIGLINKMFEAAQEFDNAKDAIKKEYTYSDYRADHEQANYDNATHINRYK
jgi:hypothetical protein